MFKRLRGAKAWVLGVGSVIGIAAGIVDYTGIATLFLPQAVRYLPLAMIAGFAAALWVLGSEGPAVDGVLYREVIQLRHDNQKLKEDLASIETEHRRRRVLPANSRVLVRELKKGLDDLREACLKQGWSADDAMRPLVIRIVALGLDRENISYRNELAKDFSASGFHTLLDEWHAGALEHDRYLSAVTVLKEDPRNVVQPFIVAALREAEVQVREDDWPMQKPGSSLRGTLKSPAATIFIGQLR